MVQSPRIGSPEMSGYIQSLLGFSSIHLYATTDGWKAEWARQSVQESNLRPTDWLSAP